jgi:dipeptidyl aminopeptidase/acylaminoacyl peptidase
MVPLSESEAMVAALRKNGIPVWYLTAKDEDHETTATLDQARRAGLIPDRSDC